MGCTRGRVLVAVLVAVGWAGTPGSGLGAGAAVLQRAVRVDGQRFVDTASNETVTLVGPNVVVKGPPYLPIVEGSQACNDTVDDACTATGTCVTCYSFSQADVENMRAQGWNTIRLGVVWAGAQPRDEDALDEGFLERLHALLDLTDREGIFVVLDNHGDMVGTAGCGNGVPMWVQEKAAPDLIGKPLKTGYPYHLVPSLRVEDLDGYDTCGDNEALWAEYAGDANYNLLNPCCQAMNSPNPGALGYTTISQATMDYVLLEGEGRDDLVRFWGLLAEAVASHPSAVAAELMNEPMSLRRQSMFDTWRAAADAIHAVIPDLAVSLQNLGEGTIVPAEIMERLPQGAGYLLDPDTVSWIRNSTSVFYAWHWYGSPASPDAAVANALAIGEDWDCPTFATEFMSCDVWRACEDAGISRTYWHYSSYCDTGPAFGNKSVPEDTFGACILGWAGGDSSYSC